MPISKFQLSKQLYSCLLIGGGGGLIILCAALMPYQVVTFWSSVALLATLTAIHLIKKERDTEKKRVAQNENILRQKKSLLSVISNASMSIIRNSPLSETLDLILGQTLAMLSAQNGSIMLIDEKEEMTIKAAVGLDEEVIKNTRIKIGERISGWVAKNNEPLLLVDRVSDPRFQTVKENWVKDALVVPLRINGTVIGILSISNKTGKMIFTHHDLDSLALIADEISIAIENARLYEESNKRVKELSLLCEFAKELELSLELDQTFKRILDRIEKVVRADNYTIVLNNPKSGVLNLRAHRGLNIRGDFALRIDSLKREGGDFFNRIFLERKPFITPDFTLLPRRIGGLIERGGKYFFAFPLVAKDSCLGFLAFTKSKPPFISQDEIRLVSAITRQAAAAIENGRLYEELEDINLSTLKALSQAIDARDAYTKEHSELVSKFSVLVARAMGLPEEEIKLIKFASLLHDVGKIGVREAILVKPGKLSSDEYAEVRRHPFIGMQILKPLQFLDSAIPLVYHHHERYDGAGYLDGLCGEEIPLGARIIGVADAFEAMTANRPYRLAKPVEEALSILQEEAGKQFDPQVVETFVGIYSGLGQKKAA